MKLCVWAQRLSFVVLALGACVPRERPGGGAEAAAGAGGRGVPPAAAASGGARDREASAAGSPDPLLSAVFTDDFERTELGPAWRATSRAWRIDGGRLCASNARNHPVWLARRLPVNASIEFEALSESEDGDIKAEYWGDGQSAATGRSYTDATSYLTIFGGWKNHFHVLARLDEHAQSRKEIKLEPGAADPMASTVVPHRVYKFQVERRDGYTVSWRVDGTDILAYRDEEPLLGPGHEHFGFNEWQVRVCFDNLRVTPLP